MIDLKEIRRRPVAKGSAGVNRLNDSEKAEIAQLVQDGKFTATALAKKTRLSATSIRKWAQRVVARDVERMKEDLIPAAANGNGHVAAPEYRMAVKTINVHLTPEQAREALLLWFRAKGINMEMVV